MVNQTILKSESEGGGGIDGEDGKDGKLRQVGRYSSIRIDMICRYDRRVGETTASGVARLVV